MTTALQSLPASHPALRLRLAAHGGMPRPLDGAWWPRSYDLLAPGRGRWDLLVVPPGTTEEAAEPLMAVAASGHV
jgi:hypothetical protein